MAATSTAYSVTSLGEAAAAAAERGFGLTTTPGPEEGMRGRVHIRRDFGITSFGVNAFYQATSGAFVIGEHDELGPGASGQEELYVVVDGGCTFTVDGEEVDAPRGTAVYVGDPATKRSARATEDGTLVLVVGGRPGEAYSIGAGEAMGQFFQLYREHDYAGALEECRGALETHPGNPLVLYNIACLESLLGLQQEAFASLEQAIAGWPKFKENAATDDDFASLRDDARFQALVA
jgi:hypothetical protein